MALIQVCSVKHNVELQALLHGPISLQTLRIKYALVYVQLTRFQHMAKPQPTRASKRGIVLARHGHKFKSVCVGVYTIAQWLILQLVSLRSMPTTLQRVA